MKSTDADQSVLDALRAQIAIVDRDGRIVTTNTAWRRDDPSRRLNERFESAARSGLEDVLSGRRRSFSLEYPYDPDQTGDPGWYSLRIAPVSRGALVRHVDITDRRRTERSLLESQQRFRAMFEMSMDAILLQNDDAVIVDANASACSLFGWAKSELLGTAGWRLLGTGLDQFQERWQQFLDAGELRGEIVLVGAGHRAIDVEFAARARVLPGLHMAALRDISRRKQLEQQVLQSQKMETVGRLAGGVAHDFNNLLTAILGYADLLVDSHDEHDPRRADAIEVRTAALRASVLTRQLLTFSRHETPRPQHIDLNCVIAGMHTLLSRTIGEHMVTRVLLAPELPRVRADLGQMEQVIANLAVNARDAMPDGGEVTFETSVVTIDREIHTDAGEAEPGPYVELAVLDRGHGIPPDVLPHIFDPFFTTKDTGKGTGLGLSTVYGIVIGSGGHILVERRPGGGTAFRIRLPIALETA
jgi:PAS domain S-box-containing protein